MAINPDHGALPTFSGGDEREFPGRCVWGDEAALEKTAVGGGFAAGAGSSGGVGRGLGGTQPCAAFLRSCLRPGVLAGVGRVTAVLRGAPGGECSASPDGQV